MKAPRFNYQTEHPTSFGDTMLGCGLGITAIIIAIAFAVYVYKHL